MTFVPNHPYMDNNMGTIDVKHTVSSRDIIEIVQASLTAGAEFYIEEYKSGICQLKMHCATKIAHINIVLSLGMIKEQTLNEFCNRFEICRDKLMQTESYLGEHFWVYVYELI